MRFALSALLALLLAGCSTPVDPGDPDASADPSSDAATASGSDAATASGFDAATASGSDASGTTGSDAAIAPGADAAVSGPDAASGPDPATACAAAADSICVQLEACSTFGLAAIYGDLATCKARVAAGCLPVFGAPGSSSTPSRTEKCAVALRLLTCDDIKAGDTGPDCAAVPGSLADGAACGDDAQCPANFCARATTSQCGICSPKSTEGGACVNGACSSGFSCPNGSTTCIKPVAGQVGEACTYQEQCDLANGVACDATSTKKCIQIGVAKGAGQACGVTLAGFVICPGGGACSALFAGVCSATAADGASCSEADTGPKCLAPAKCVGGTCQLPDPGSCK